MNLFSISLDYLLTHSLLNDWPQMEIITKTIMEKEPRNCSLPVISCGSMGAAPLDAVPGVAAITCMQIGIVLIDDMLDLDPRGLYRQLGSATAANLASAFQAAGLGAIMSCDANQQIKLEILVILNRMVYKTALGQNLDVQNPTSEEDYWMIVGTKSSPFFQAALQIGALLGGSDFDTARQIGELGVIYGEMIQLHDDLNDALEVPAGPDWTTGRQSLPLLFASTVEHPERERFLELRPKVSDAQALSEAQLILVHCGAVSYVLHELLEKDHEAQKILHKLVLPGRDKLEGLFAEIIEPVHGLMLEVERR